LIRIRDYQDAAMPCGDCCVCGEELDHSEAGFCGTCGQGFHWSRCGDWHGSQHRCNTCAEDEEARNANDPMNFQ